MIIGAHIKRKKTIVATLEDLQKHVGNGPTVLQIFVCNPRSGRITEDNIKKYREEATSTALLAYMHTNDCRLWIHSPYTFNIARPFAPDAYWVTTIIKELQLADILGADGVIVHVGHGDYDQGTREMKKTIKYILKHFKGNAKLVIETASGMGAEVLADLRALRDFVSGFDDNRLRICVDTAHVWAAGYDPVDALRFIGRGKLAAVHFNNTSRLFGDRVDRHECMGGVIPLKTMRDVALLCTKWKVPLIMETPRECWKKEIIMFRENRHEQDQQKSRVHPHRGQLEHS